jgi:Recombination endonuclease VII
LCEKFKVWDDFYAGAGANGKDTRCKECMKGKTRVRNRLPEVRAAESERWQTRWQIAHPGEEYVPLAERPPRPLPVKKERVLRVAQSVQEKGAKRNGITLEQRLQLDSLAVYGVGLCDLHGGPETMVYQRYGGVAIRSLSVDHDHACTRHAPDKMCAYCIRGLVCCDCNRNVLRAAERHSELAKRFTDYLERRPLL